MKKSTLILALLALTAFTVRAQHFDWAEGYSSTGENGFIKGTVTDSAGDLYILGAFSGFPSWGDTTLMPISHDLMPIGTVIAKNSPDGEMLWRKALHTGNVSILVAEEDNGLVAYPNPFHQRVNIKCNETITAAYVTDMMGRRDEVRLLAEGNGRYSIDLTARPQAIYLLTVITANNKQHTVRLLKK